MRTRCRLPGDGLDDPPGLHDPAAFGSWLAVAVALLLLASHAGAAPRCDPDDAGLRLPEDLCALGVARETGPVRNLAVSKRGDVFATLNTRGGSKGGILALRDADGDGRADGRRRFGRGDGHGIALTDAHLYYAAHDRIVRWAWEDGRLEPAGEPETVVGGFPDQAEHRVGVAVGPDGSLYLAADANQRIWRVLPRSARP